MKTFSLEETAALGLHPVTSVNQQGTNMSKKILRLPSVLELTGVGRSTIYLWMQQGLFPRNVQLGPRVSGWREEDIEKWLESRQSTQSPSLRAP